MTMRHCSAEIQIYRTLLSRPLGASSLDFAPNSCIAPKTMRRFFDALTLAQSDAFKEGCAELNSMINKDLKDLPVGCGGLTIFAQLL